MILRKLFFQAVDALNAWSIVMRVIRHMSWQDEAMPDLHNVPEGKVKLWHLYRYYGRVLLTRKNPDRFRLVYRSAYTGQEIPEETYRKAKAIKPNSVRKEREGHPCHLCYMCKVLPCRCDFNTGICTGYYRLIHEEKQYSNNPKL